MAVRHSSQSPLSIAINYQNAHTLLDVLVAFWKTAPLCIHKIQLQLNLEPTCYDDIMVSCSKYVGPGMELTR
jgi:hypothetical protein